MFVFLVPETLWIEHGAEDEIADDDRAQYEASEDGARVRGKLMSIPPGYKYFPMQN